MSEFKGTKGKWLLNPLTNPTNPDYYCLYTKSGSFLTVQHIGTISKKYNDNPEETQYNALLISKAPELLEALIIAHKFIEENKLKNYMIELLNRQLPNLEQLIKEATEL